MIRPQIGQITQESPHRILLAPPVKSDSYQPTFRIDKLHLTDFRAVTRA